MNTGSTNRFRYLWLMAGFVALGIAITGYIFPVLPGTPFMLIAAACFARSSPHLHHKLRNNSRFGKAIRDWEDHRALSTSGRKIAVPVILLSFAFSIFMLRQKLYLAGMLALLCLILLVFLYRLPAPPEKKND